MRLWTKIGILIPHVLKCETTLIERCVYYWTNPLLGTYLTNALTLALKLVIVLLYY